MRCHLFYAYHFLIPLITWLIFCFLTTDEGKSVVVSVVDRCADDTCLVGNLDFSRSAFGLLASFDLGRLNGMTWEWVA